MGESRVDQLTLMREENDEAYWQLFDAQSPPCFPLSRRIQFIVVLSTPQHKVPTVMMAGTEVGRRVRVSFLQHASQAEFLAAVRACYGGCVMTGTRLTDRHSWPWGEACHIDTRENEEGGLVDNSVDNGLFLCSDLQRLFINGLISIDGDGAPALFAYHPSVCSAPEKTFILRTLLNPHRARLPPRPTTHITY
ncbi:HNH endonuclease|nr:HNH endonuclease [Candidatus Pantoea persica]